MISEVPVHERNPHYSIEVKPLSKKDEKNIEKELKQTNIQKENYIKEVRENMQKLDLSDKINNMRERYKKLVEQREMYPVESNIIHCYEKSMIGTQNLRECNIPNHHMEALKVEIVNKNENILKVKVGDNRIIELEMREKWSGSNRIHKEKEEIPIGELDFDKYDCYSILRHKEEIINYYNIKKGKFEFSVSYENSPLERCNPMVKNPSKKNITTLLREIKEENSKVETMRMINSYKSNSCMLSLVRLIENIDNKTIVKYGINTPEIIDTVIEKFNLKYEHIPQRKSLLISKTPISFEKNYFSKKFPHKQNLNEDEWEMILNEIGVPKKRRKKYKNSDLNIYKMKEYENILKMIKCDKLNREKLNYYRYCMKLSDHSSADIINIIEEGETVKNKLEKRGYKFLIDDIEKSSLFYHKEEPMKCYLY